MTPAVKDRILALLSEHGVFADPEVVDYIATVDSPEDFCRRLLRAEDEPPLFLDMAVLKQLEDTVRRGSTKAEKAPPTRSPPEAEPEKMTEDIEGEAPPRTAGKGLMAPGFEPFAENIEPRVHVIKDITNRSTCEGTLKDFNVYFKNRYQKLKKLLRNRLEMRSSTSIEYAKDKNLAGEVKVIGIVSEVRTAPWGGVIIRVEDDTGEITATLGKDETAIKDEVVGLVGKLDDKGGRFGTRLRCKTLVRPGITTSREFKKADDPVYAMFISDIHLGSNTFLHRPWRNLIRWLNGHIDIQSDLVSRLKYIVINGDIVDGIGIYPNQEEELDIRDIYAQYEELARQLGDIPKHIQMIILPGNHDAVRPAEPQPTFPQEIRKLFPGNCTFVGNPSLFTIHGVEVLAYHGRSMDDTIPAMKLSYDRPIEVMEAMLHMRHLAPVYGERTPIAPEKNDTLVIESVPDIFVTGHLHKTDVKLYRNCLLIQASAWQSQTSFQKMMNLQPDPAKAVMVDLQTLSAKKLNFSDQQRT